MDRRELLKAALATWASSRLLQAAGSVHLTDKLALLDAGRSNVLAFSADDGMILVDSGAPKSGDQLMAALNSKVHALFNTHYHLDQTANNERFAQAGAKIIAHERTREWMSTDYWVPAEGRYEKARPKAARPTETFQTTGALTLADEQIGYGYLLLAHTSGDIYVHFKNANVLAVGDVASPVRDPSLDYFTGAWIGGRVDAMVRLLTMCDDRTRIVPGYGPVMTKAQLNGELVAMKTIYDRVFDLVRKGDESTDMLKAGVMNGLARTWKDPQRFLYDVQKGLWAHHNKLAPDVV